jgi:hypothetical protein
MQVTAKHRPNDMPVHQRVVSGGPESFRLPTAAPSLGFPSGSPRTRAVALECSRLHQARGGEASRDQSAPKGAASRQGPPAGPLGNQFLVPQAHVRIVQGGEKGLRPQRPLPLSTSFPAVTWRVAGGGGPAAGGGGPGGEGKGGH